MNIALPGLIASESRYLLLDGAQYSKPPWMLLRSRWAAEASPLFDGVLSDGSRDVAPYLVRLRTPQDVPIVLKALDAHNAGASGVAWLDSLLPHEQLLERLQRRLATVLPNSKRMLLRMYDTRVLPQLAAVLDATQAASYFAVARCWWYRDTHARWSSIDGTVPERDPLEEPLALSAMQRRALQDACYPYAVMAHFDDTAPELVERISPEARYAFFRDTLEAAERSSVTATNEVMLFATIALLEGADFHQQPIWRDRLLKVEKGEARLTDIFDEHYQESTADAD